MTPRLEAGPGADAPFYGEALSAVHDAGFTDWARAAGDWLLERLVQAGHPVGRLTDLGCGSGVLLRRLADAGYDVAGVDRAAAMIDLARRRIPEAELEVGSIYEYAIAPSLAVTAVGEVLNYLPVPGDPRALHRLFRRIHRALPSGGLFVCDVLERHPDAPRLLETTSTREGSGWTVRSRARLSPDGSMLTREIRIELEGRSPETELHRCRLLDRSTLLDELRATGFRVELRAGYGDLALPGPRRVVVAVRS